MNQKRSETLIKKVDGNTDILISRLQSIIALSASTSTQEIQSSEMLQIESNAMMIIRLVEELLSISRSLKESWILGQISKTNESDDPTRGIYEKVNLVIDKIIKSDHYEEEQDDESDDDIVNDVDNNDKVNEIKKEENTEENKTQEKQIDAGDDSVKIKDEEMPDVDQVVVKEEGLIKVEDEDKKEDTELKKEKETENFSEIKQESPNVENVDLIDQGQNINIENELTSNDINFGDLDFKSFGDINEDDQNDDLIMLE